MFLNVYGTVIVAMQVSGYAAEPPQFAQLILQQ